MKITAETFGGLGYFDSKQASKQARKQASKQASKPYLIKVRAREAQPAFLHHPPVMPVRQHRAWREDGVRIYP